MYFLSFSSIAFTNIAAPLFFVIMIACCSASFSCASSSSCKPDTSWVSLSMTNFRLFIHFAMVVMCTTGDSVDEVLPIILFQHAATHLPTQPLSFQLKSSRHPNTNSFKRSLSVCCLSSHKQYKRQTIFLRINLFILNILFRDQIQFHSFLLQVIKYSSYSKVIIFVV